MGLTGYGAARHLATRQGANDHTAGLGYTVGAAHRVRNRGSRALKIMTDHHFATVGMPRVTLSIAAENSASVAVARSAGYCLVDEPPVSKAGKRRTPTMRTWAHDSPTR